MVAIVPRVGGGVPIVPNVGGRGFGLLFLPPLFASDPSNQIATVAKIRMKIFMLSTKGRVIE